jgi:hypothetical protein
MPSDFNEILTFKTVSANVDEFKKLTSEDDNVEESKYFVSLVPFDENPGSSGGLKFISALLNSPNEEIFRTKVICDIVDIYWKKTLPKFMIQWLFYLTFAVLVTLYVDYPSTFFAVIMMIYSCLFFVEELYELTIVKFKYLYDPWNFVDFGRIALGIGFFFE